MLCLEVRRILLIAHPQSLKRQESVAMAPLGLSRRKENLKNSRGMLRRRRDVSQPRERAELAGGAVVSRNHRGSYLCSWQQASVGRWAYVCVCVCDNERHKRKEHTHAPNAISYVNLNVCAPSERVQ